ncbi:MAG: hypothetical protein JO228_05285 [Xanthobacteraceae bacterium]|nr:hypothetical protein [Xanthobacteraceae bacterium]
MSSGAGKPLDVRACEEFLLYEARLLDEARFDDWLALFTPDAWYWVPSQPNQPDPLETVSLIYDDRRLLETRVRRLASPRMATAEAISAELARRGCQRLGRRTEAVSARIRSGDNHHSAYDDRSHARFIDPRTLSKAVDAILPADRVVASDSGHFCGWVPRYLRVPNARASCLSHSFQSVGLGLASAIGLAVANPGKLAVLGAGDGGFLMSMADFETALRLKLRLCILIYNDSSYAAEVHYFRRKGYPVEIVQFPDTDFAAIARGYGARAVTVRRLDDLDPLKAWVAEGAGGVFIIDGKINPDLEADWHAEHFP